MYAVLYTLAIISLYVDSVYNYIKYVNMRSQKWHLILRLMAEILHQLIGSFSHYL